MFISRARYNNLTRIIDAQKQLIEEYKMKVDSLEKQNELREQVIIKMERIMEKERTSDGKS